jgi:patatin-like phospholipase/acyl hydrolase
VRVLSIDGGGCFGRAPAEVLGLVSASDFDLFAGSSIGSAIAGALAVGKDPATLADFFDEWMPVVFKKRMPLPFRAKYGTDGLQEALKAQFGNTLFGDVDTRLLVTAVDVKTARLKVFDSENFADARLLMREVVQASCSAPTFFAPCKIGAKTYCDGGVIANRPDAIACLFADAPMNEILLVSLGTGDAPNHDMSAPKSLSLWLRFLVRALLEGASDDLSGLLVDHMSLKSIYRWQPMRKKGWQMDAPTDMMEACEAWAEDIAKARSDLWQITNGVGD